MNKKEETNKLEQRKNNSRAKYKCPSELEDLIYQFNLVPISAVMPNFESQMEDAIRSLRENLGENDFISFPPFDDLRSQISHMPLEFLVYLDVLAQHQTYISGRRSPFIRSPSKMIEYKLMFINQYVEYCWMRESMLALIHRLEYERGWANELISKNILKMRFHHNSPSSRWNAFPIPNRNFIRRGNDGKLQNAGLTALIGKFDDSRLRLCKICGERIFWAKREESQTCSKLCFGILRTRRYRTLTVEEKAKIKEDRINNRKNVKDKKAKTSKRGEN